MASLQQLRSVDNTDPGRRQDSVQAACCATSGKHQFLHRHQGGTCEYLTVIKIWLTAPDSLGITSKEISALGLVLHNCIAQNFICGSTLLDFPMNHLEYLLMLHFSLSFFFFSWHWNTGRAKTTRCASLLLLGALWVTKKKRSAEFMFITSWLCVI